MPEHFIEIMEIYFTREFSKFFGGDPNLFGIRPILESDIFESSTLDLLLEHWLFESENPLDIAKHSYRESLSNVSFSNANNKTASSNFDLAEFQFHRLLNESIHARVNGEIDNKEDIVRERLMALFS